MLRCSVLSKPLILFELQPHTVWCWASFSVSLYFDSCDECKFLEGGNLVSCFFVPSAISSDPQLRLGVHPIGEH